MTIEAMRRGHEEKRAAIHLAVAEAEEGVFISQEAMDAWVASWGTDTELPPPEPDIRPGSE
ncbi:MAG: hypothetical protein OXN81_17825 [Alphaproteobacteria bacterium]|nr:hypothetical protein [Alphaproteobacteria bacterium]